MSGEAYEPHLVADDGWREVELAPDGRLAFDADGVRVLMTVDEARAALPDWEFSVEVHNGDRRVWAR